MNSRFDSMQPKMPPANFWSLSPAEILTELKSGKAGLTSHEASVRLKFYGRNELAIKERASTLKLFLSRFMSPLILILIGASLISYLFGGRLDAMIILVMVILSVTVDFVQRYRADSAAEKLKQKVSLTATVFRDGVEKEIPMSSLVPGDIINLSAGDIVPADARLIEANYLYINQAALSGESFPVAKRPHTTVSPNSPFTQRENSVFMGTTVVSGSGVAVVAQTGRSSEFGKISLTLTRKRPPTEFERGIREFSMFMLQVILGLVVFIFFFHTLFKHNILESLLFATALAVGLTPEMLPLMIAINLSRGAIRMAKHGVIVKDLSAIENLGSMDILCTDKTGTISEGKIKLERYINVHGKEDTSVLFSAYINSYFDAGLKSPLDDAILGHKEMSVAGFSKVDEVPFDFTRKRVSVIVEREQKCELISKGAVESIVGVCTHYRDGNKDLPFNSKVHREISERFDSLSEQGFRMLAVASRKISRQNDYTSQVERDLVFLGFTIFYDPPKATVRESLERLQKLGITVKILTGDNELVTKKICSEVGIKVTSDQLARSLDVEQLDDAGLGALAEKAVIFSGLTPEQKERVIVSLKHRGHVIGFLGDGINDAPPLNASDIGISVNNAVDVAKESADFILLHKSLRILSDGVAEGRKTFGNVMKYILMSTSSNFGNMFSVAGASLFLSFLPMLPKQLLLNNFLYDLSQVTLAVDRVDAEYISRPKKWNIKYIRQFMLMFGPISSIFDFLTYFAMLFVFKASVPLFQTTWFVESLVTQSIVIFSIRTRQVPFFKSIPSKLFFLNILGVILLTLALPHIPQLNRIFSFVPPPPAFYLVLAGFVVVYLLLTEFMKRWFYQRFEL